MVDFALKQLDILEIGNFCNCGVNANNVLKWKSCQWDKPGDYNTGPWVVCWIRVSYTYLIDLELSNNHSVYFCQKYPLLRLERLRIVKLTQITWNLFLWEIDFFLFYYMLFLFSRLCIFFSFIYMAEFKFMVSFILFLSIS